MGITCNRIFWALVWLIRDRGGRPGWGREVQGNVIGRLSLGCQGGGLRGSTGIWESSVQGNGGSRDCG